jgi:hypothetical protein
MANQDSGGNLVLEKYRQRDGQSATNVARQLRGRRGNGSLRAFCDALLLPAAPVRIR